MLFLDTSVLVDALVGPRRGWRVLETIIVSHHLLAVSTLVLYEWLRGGRSSAELAIQRRLVPPDRVIPFTSHQARLSAELYRALPRARARAADFGIAACALSHGMPLWTLNRDGFADVPGLRLFDPSL